MPNYWQQEIDLFFFFSIGWGAVWIEEFLVYDERCVEFLLSWKFGNIYMILRIKLNLFLIAFSLFIPLIEGSIRETTQNDPWVELSCVTITTSNLLGAYTQSYVWLIFHAFAVFHKMFVGISLISCFYEVKMN